LIIYQRALGIELENYKLLVAREIEMSVFYKGNAIGSRRIDFLINDLICVEIKALIRLDGRFLRMLNVHSDITYLKHDGKPVLSFISIDGEPSYLDVGGIIYLWKAGMIYPNAKKKYLFF
jgi:GxxExxY protein